MNHPRVRARLRALAMFLGRETVGLPELAAPRDAFVEATLPEPTLRRAAPTGP
ncbi:hypothetical protein ACIGN6_00395 [Streptomyces sp. NPDC053792]|uniref:hypothetical protein n=1 Tax=unclassified Streptomyces TaxID=2593676 RepID=UPI00343D594E